MTFVRCMPSKNKGLARKKSKKRTRPSPSVNGLVFHA